jgi:hypothetical protein
MADRKATERLIRKLEHEADQQLVSDPDGAELKLAECRRLRKLLPATSYVRNWPQGQKELPLPDLDTGESTMGDAARRGETAGSEGRGALN